MKITVKLEDGSIWAIDARDAANRYVKQAIENGLQPFQDERYFMRVVIRKKYQRMNLTQLEDVILKWWEADPISYFNLNTEAIFVGTSWVDWKWKLVKHAPPDYMISQWMETEDDDFKLLP